MYFYVGAEASFRYCEAPSEKSPNPNLNQDCVEFLLNLQRKIIPVASVYVCRRNKGIRMAITILLCCHISSTSKFFFVTD